MKTNNSGFVEWVIVVVIAACFGVGLYYQATSDKVDAPAEQVAEAILDSQGIEVDFSRDKKSRDGDTRESEREADHRSVVAVD